ncbi:MAG: fibronectin type III domain-containing protein [Bacteroidales bacterium]|nr:fibronectin type III domain-containing protein [Bacteroidales bacterium]
MMKKLSIISLLAVLVIACGSKENPEQGPTSLDKPTGLSAVTTETSASISWSAVSGAQGYTYRLTQSGKLVKNGTALQNQVVIDGLSAGTTYLFQVYATAGTVKSSYSDALEVKTQNASGGGSGGGSSDAPAYAEFQIPADEENLGALAFPGAEGGGMYTTGGRGGKVYHVTSLADDGSKGTLRYGIENESRPLTIVFDVAGIIPLKKDLKDSKGNLTIAGQTAPGDGICLKNYTMNLQADNVIIRYIRFRLGDEGPNVGDSEDCIWGRFLSNIILDHCSMSWSIDESASFYGNVNMTLQWCILAESLQKTVHSKGNHGYGGIWGGKNASFHHNLLAHHQNRTPRFDHQYLYEESGKSVDTYRGNVDYRNCVNYNWGSSNSCYGGEGGHFNLVNNYYKKGPDSNDKKYFMEADGGYTYKKDNVEYKKDYDWAYLHLSGNYNHEYPSGHASYPDGVYWKKIYEEYSKSHEGHVSSTPFPLKGKDGKDAYITTHPASTALERVLAGAGASLKRDNVDSRICNDVKNTGGKIVNNMEDVQATYQSTWPVYSGTKVTDTDGDGIPDAKEQEWGLNKDDASDGAAFTFDKDKKRYTNLEMYLHYLVKDIVARGNEGGTYTKL